MKDQYTTHSAREIREDDIEVIEAIFKLEFWQEQLFESRSERRQIITDKTLSDPRRAYKLNLNHDMTQAIRERFRECQEDYAHAVRESIDRIAQSTAGLLEFDSALPSNDPVFDDYEGVLSE